MERAAAEGWLRAEPGPPATDDDVRAFEQRTGLRLPPHVGMFFREMNGLTVASPMARVLPLRDIDVDHRGRAVFCILDDQHRLAFDTTSLNAANQWSIVNADSGYRVTLTMPSFWSNKLLGWIEKERRIWEEEWP